MIRNTVFGVIIVVAGTLAMSKVEAQEMQSVAKPNRVVRSYSIPGSDPAATRAELVFLGKQAGTDDLVDLVTEFIPEYGQAQSVLPMNLGATGGMSGVLYRFKDKRGIAVLVHSDEPSHLAGPSACRIFMDPSRGTPDQSKFAQVVHWCSNAVTLANIDSGAIAPN